MCSLVLYRAKKTNLDGGLNIKKLQFKLVAEKERYSLYINGDHVLECKNDAYAHGMFGFGCLEDGENEIKNVHVLTSTQKQV